MLKYWVWLAELPGLANQTRLALLRHFSTPEDIFYADAGEILLVEGMTRQQATVLENHDLTTADRILADCQRLGISLLTLQDAAYPGRLKNIYDPPCLLYIKGRLPVFDEELTVAVVGTRDCTPYGIAVAEKLSYELTAGGAIVVSGLAKGIDAAATRGALRAGGITVGVLGNGIDVHYPYESAGLYADVAAAGVLISEYPPGTAAVGSHFPARNRILSGLAQATVVVEAGEKSGALITANWAMEQGRDVFAVPGPVTVKESAGCNRLIQSGAGLVTEAADILKEYEPRFPTKLTEGQTMPEIPQIDAPPRTEAKPVLPAIDAEKQGLTDDQIALLRVMDAEEPIQVDDLIEATGIPTRRVLSALTMLEIDELVKQHSGKRYTRAVTLRK